jgi:MraZ protein
MSAYRFLGNYTHSIDSKKRVAIPAKFRQQLPEGKKVIITRQPEGCLAVFPEDEFELQIFSKLDDLDQLSGRNRRTVRDWSGNAYDGDVDKQGRINLGNIDLKKVGIKKEVVFVGAYRRFEIWAHDAWEEYEAAGWEDEESPQDLD